MKKLAIVFSLMMMVAFAGSLMAQELPVYWEDHFDDYATDPGALKDVGWLYYGPSDNVIGQVVEETTDGELHIKSGSYSGMAGVGLVQTNGVPEIDTTDNAKTHKLLVANDYSNPNQIIFFKVAFLKITSSYFILCTRMVQTDSSETIPDADPTQSPAYVLYVSPLEGKYRIGKYEGELKALQPDQWTYFGEGTYSFQMNVYYYFKFYLNDGDLKAKVWEGYPEDEPTTWNIEATDPAPRVTGKYTMFGLLGTPPGGDEIVLDDIVVTATKATAVNENRTQTPATFQLDQNYPNPFNPTTSISFSVNSSAPTVLKIYNEAGQLVKTLVNGKVGMGTHVVKWNGTNNLGEKVHSGVYFYELVNGSQKSVKKLLLMK